MARILLCLVLMVSVSCASLQGYIASEQEVYEKLALNQGQGKVTSFRGVAEITFHLKDQKGSVEAIIIADQKGNLRVETANFFGVPLTVFSIYRGKVTYYIIPEEKIYIGLSSEAMPEKVLPFSLSEADLKGLIFFSKETYDKFKVHSRHKLQFYTFKKDEITDLYYPSGLKLTKRDNEDEFVRIEWDGYDLNPEKLPESLFKLEPPAQARIYAWDQVSIRPLLKGHSEERK